MKELLTGIGLVVTRDIKARIRKNMVSPKTSKSDGTTLVKSAKLMNSISYALEGNAVRVGTNLRYARIHHTGGVIKPKTAKYLAIPLTKEAAVRKPREFTDTFIAKGCIMRTLADGKIEALYALKKSVTIPARPYMFIDDNTRASLISLVKAYALKQFQGVI